MTVFRHNFRLGAENWENLSPGKTVFEIRRRRTTVIRRTGNGLGCRNDYVSDNWEVASRCEVIANTWPTSGGCVQFPVADKRGIANRSRRFDEVHRDVGCRCRSGADLHRGDFARDGALYESDRRIVAGIAHGRREAAG